MSTASSATSLSSVADRLMLLALGVSGLVAIAIGVQYQQLTLAAVAAVALLGLGALGYLIAPASQLSRALLASALMAMTALHIQLGRGTLEFHFGVFVVLALLLVYRDWRPIVVAAGLIAVHHIAFDRLQAAGSAVYCLTQPDFLKILIHAGYVVAQAGFEIYMALMMRNVANVGEELNRLVAHVSAKGEVALDVDAVPAETASAQALKQALLRLRSAMVSVSGTINGIQSASSEIASGNADLSQRTEQTSSSLQRTASSMEQLTATVQHSAAAAAQANDIAHGAAQAAERGGAVVKEVVSNMDEIAASSKRIADITGVIDGIAFQTNILALNAAVEAARAGEQGRGFAVVAGEVRSLAQRAAEAAREIKGLIGASVERVESGARLVHEAGSAMGEIVAGVRQVTDTIAQISSSAKEQSAGIGEVNQAVAQLDTMTQQNAALVEQSAAAAESLRAQAEQLAGVV
ncbi:MAG: chemotaxis protein, partial [Burkholderiales bacterium]|nr:chemotaxis protein [Burkholderiales bacterium]